MTHRPAKAEWIVVGAFLTIGTILRCWHLDRECVEHFDEGVYSSILWYDGVYGPTYPAREFFAPPGLPTMIEVASWIPGASRMAPFLPSICFGIGSIILFWWIGRTWFGTAAGVVLAATVAMSDFHIQYSRMALTDVPTLFWIVLAVAMGALAIDRQSLKVAAAAGFCCGIAWWIKYTGWLPLAIVGSGAALWWIRSGRQRTDVRALKTLMIVGLMLVTAFATFAPWWIQLQSIGGYSAITAHHRSFAASGDSLFSAWRKNMTDQLSFQIFQDGIFGVLSLGLGVLWAAWIRWNAAVCSTWNKTDAVSAQANSSDSTFPPRSLALRFIVASIALILLSLRIRTPLMMMCMTLGGIAGMHLWPVLHRVWIRRRTNDVSPAAPDAMRLTSGDLEVAATADPSLGFSVLLCWFMGLLIVTPLYHPYARLFFPLLASIWIASAAGVSWWLESNLSVARRGIPLTKVSRWQTMAQWIVGAMVAGAVLASFVQFNQNYELEPVPLSELLSVPGYEERRSIEHAALAIADSCMASARDEVPPDSVTRVPVGETIHPGKILRADAGNPEESGRSQEPTDDLPQSQTESRTSSSSTNEQSAADSNDPSLITNTPIHPRYSMEQRRVEKMIVYVFGEPALLMHLNAAGITAAPISHLNLQDPGDKTPAIPTFVVIGPHAKRTKGFWDERFARASILAEVAEVPYFPGTATLLDLFSLKWRRLHPESSQQIFEVYRVL
ncbi:MAG: ArnT family glycosyltransferase [Planctomycetota bacterium]